MTGGNTGEDPGEQETLLKGPLPQPERAQSVGGWQEHLPAAADLTVQLAGQL